MSSEPVFVGLDYHQASIQVCVMDRSGKVLVNRSRNNDRNPIRSLVGKRNGPVRVAIETYHGAVNLAEELVTHFGWSVHLAGFVARMKRNPDKDDFRDAQMLADLERVGYLPRVWLALQEARELRHLVR